MTNSEEPPSASQSQDDQNAPEHENRDPNEDESDEEEDNVEDFDEEGKLINESQMSHDYLKVFFRFKQF